jgi:hypothetical protein
MIHSQSNAAPAEAASEDSQALFHPARLMTPAEVEKATVNQPPEVRQRTKGQWQLCGDVSAPMFAVLKAVVREAVSVRVDSFGSPAGARYGVVSHQVNGFVHRFLLPLYDPFVADFVLAMRTEELGFLLGNDGAGDALLIRSPCRGKALAPVLSVVDPLPREKLYAVLAELPKVINAVKVPTLRRSEPVVEVSVSVLLPTRALMQLWRLNSAAAA